jgi:hypothetical protein
MFATAVFVTAGIASAQSDQTGSRLTIQGPADQPNASNDAIIRDGLGRPCLDIEAVARRRTIDPQMLDHVVSVKNNCPRNIHAKICYFNSEHCNDLVVAAYKRVDTILGTMRGVRFFRYSISQK